MKDKHGREIDYLRISLTDACNLRCIYCMPESNVKFNNIEGALTNRELEILINIFGELGTKKIRFTGGEPLLRKDIHNLIKVAKDSGVKKIALTTNGIFLEEKLPDLLEAGLSEVNISLDTLDSERFAHITRGGDISKVLKAIDKSLENGIKVKLNVVIIEGINDDEFLDLCDLSIEKDIDIRFIELMPIGEGIKFKGKTQDQLLEILKQNRQVVSSDFDTDGHISLHGKLGKGEVSGPARYTRIQGAKGRIGFISAMSDHFCDSCNRVRITPDGFLKQCLHFKSGVDLKVLMEENKDKSLLMNKIRETIFNKPVGHKFNEDKKAEDKRFMFQIGG